MKEYKLKQLWQTVLLLERHQTQTTIHFLNNDVHRKEGKNVLNSAGESPNQTWGQNKHALPMGGGRAQILETILSNTETGGAELASSNASGHAPSLGNDTWDPADCLYPLT